jgi:hypothetical protein
MAAPALLSGGSDPVYRIGECFRAVSRNYVAIYMYHHLSWYMNNRDHVKEPPTAAFFDECAARCSCVRADYSAGGRNQRSKAGSI